MLAPMKTIFTSKSLGYVAVCFVMALISLNLSAQTSHSVTVSSFQFSPANLTITEGDEVVWTNTGGSHNVNGTKATFPSNPVSFGNSVGTGWTYKFTFSTPGTYDYHCDPHSGSMIGKIVVNAKSVSAPTLTINFTGMTPHVGQTLWLAVIDKSNSAEIFRIKKVVDAAAFIIEASGIEVGKSYNVDFFADHNKNGVYDAPPADHAWRMALDNVTGNSVLNFIHNTTFTDIVWRYKLNVHFTGMTPHIGQTITLFLKQNSNGTTLDNLVIPSIASATFDINSFKIKPGVSYTIDFYADHNKNGSYDAPPTDHAWRLPLTNVKGDTIVNFAHNTTFTNISIFTSNNELKGITDNFNLYPNPASEYVTVTLPPNYAGINYLKVYSITGAVMDEKNIATNSNQFNYDVSRLKTGVYFMEINAGTRKDILKFIKE